MTKEIDFEVKLSFSEYSALMDIRGLPEKAHYLVMCATSDEKNRWLLQGSDEAFDQLLATVNEEIDYNVAPKKNMPALRRIRKFLTPVEHDDF